MKFSSLLPAFALTTGLAFAQEATPATAAIPTTANTPVNTPATTVAPPVSTTPAAEVPAAAPVAAPASVEPPATPAPQAEAPAPIPQTQVLSEGTPINGTIQGFLKADQSPYLVNGNITVEANTVLIIESGVVLQFAPGTGLYVKGQLVTAGTRFNPVRFRSASIPPRYGDWNGIFLSGNEPSEIKNAIITGAAYGIALENTSLVLQSSTVEKTMGRGIYAKNSNISLSECQFLENKGAAIHIDSYSQATMNDILLEKNHVALYNAALAITNVTSSTFKNNDVGILDLGNSHLTLDNSEVSANKIGASAGDLLGKDVLKSIKDNESDFSQNFIAIEQTLPASPEIPGVESRPINKEERIGALLAQTGNEKTDSTKKTWNIMGNIAIDNHYHMVTTRKNHSGKTDVIMGDSIKSGQKYKNTFQVPGFGTGASAYLLMQSPNGSVVEFNASYTGDSWNSYNVEQATLSYTDDNNRLVLGDFNKSAGEVYMSSLSLFGAGYTLSLFKNNANQPLFEIDGFFGETRKPYLVGERHPYIYKDYIEDGEAQAQRLAYGGSLKWAPLRRFDATFGAIYANDEIHDPLLRDGGSRETLTGDPMQQSFTVFADGNWLFYPGDIELNGQIAVGRADTADVYRERAINQVFTKARLSTSSMSTLRQLMANEKKISSLTKDELEEIFGENTTLSRSAMQDSLHKLIQKAKTLKKDYDGDRDEDRVLGLNWGSQNFALGASFNWNIYKTTLTGHFKYVGEDFYSEGSADQLADTRELGGEIEQIIAAFWTINFGYQLNVENAANDDETNLFGLKEGTRWGLFSDSDSDWLDEHELDNDRTKYIQNWKIENEFKFSPNVSANIGYNLEYRTQYRPYQLHGNYFMEDGVYKDKWFAERKNAPTAELIDGDVQATVDSVRWAAYMEMANEDFLASKFQERIYKNSWNAGLSINMSGSVFKVGGIWTIRTDDSKFYKDSLISEMDLSKKTIAKLGYYFGGANYFEQVYPISLATNLDPVQNYFAITPRFKSYKRDDMSEFEISIEDELEIALIKHYMILGLTGEFRYLTTSWNEEDIDIDETEYDVLGKASLTVNHTKRLSSEWYAGAAMYYRPDCLSDEYKDIYGGIRVNYAF